MNDILEFFSNNPLMNLIFMAIALLSLVVSIVLYIRGKKSRKPCFAMKSINVIRNSITNIENIDVLYEGEKINNLTITKLALWNKGKETIDSSDIAKKNPICIIANDEVKILAAELIYTKNESNNINVILNKSQNRIEVRFDYLDFEEGGIIQIYHTGTKSSDVEIIGDIKATHGFKNVNSPGFITRRLGSSLIKLFGKYSNQKYRSIMGALLILMILFYSSQVVIDSTKNEEVDLWRTLIFLSIVNIVYFFMGISLLRRTVPKGFDIFDTDS